MHIVKRAINKNIFNLYYNNELVGYINTDITSKKHLINIKTVYIYEKYRGLGYLKLFWPIFEFELLKIMNVNCKLVILAKEIYDYYGKLISLYESIGFKKEEKRVENLKYIGDVMYRLVYMIKELVYVQ